MNYTLNIGWLYPELMSTYGDRGNIICLIKRCQWRGIGAAIKNLNLGFSISELRNCDFLFMGGAQDRQQKIVMDDFKGEKAKIFIKMIEAGTVGLFICGAYQFLGHYYRPSQGEDISGLGILDLYTVHPGPDKPRCIGNVVVKMSNVKCQMSNQYSNVTMKQFNNYSVGFENHGGRTYLGKNVKPLAEVVVGYGNNGGDKTEGAVYKNAFGTYLHGPILPKNPHFADHLLGLTLEKKYGKVKLKPLDDSLEWQAHKAVVQNLGLLKNLQF